jgi:beta-phosphoglucomutase
MGSLELILARAPRTYTPEEKRKLADAKNGHYQELIATMTPGDLLPGALRALEEVRAAGLKIGLASVSRNAFTVLDRLGIRDRFDDVVDAATVVNGKPDPEIFLTAAAHLGVLPADCLGVEDAAAGVASIKDAGMYAVGVGNPEVLYRADHVIPSMAAFRLEDY